MKSCDWPLRAFETGEDEMCRVLNGLSTPIYVTDRDGRITFFNIACIDFAGRKPEAGEDRWCVTWKLFRKSGETLPHDECPMAIAIREKRPIRGIEAVTERPDGTKKRFLPYPTLILDDEGNLLGAINLFIDMADRE